jgi:tetratricopeptide (TPR) repeat protein
MIRQHAERLASSATKPPSRLSNAHAASSLCSDMPTDQQPATTALYLSYDASRDLLSAFEFGLVGDSQPSERSREVGDSFRFLLDAPAGREVGLMIRQFSEFDPEAQEMESIWRDPRFDVPALGLHRVSAGEIVLAAKAFLGGESTVNRRIFNQAISARGNEAAKLWRDCLEAGDSMAHHGLGYTMFELGRYHEAYRHLRAYSEIVPDDPWSWCWLGRACHALGETAEARTAYSKAIELTNATGNKTEAPSLLARLDAGQSAHLPDEQRPGVIRETVFDHFVFLSGLGFKPTTTSGGSDRPVALFLAGGPLSGKTSMLRKLIEQSDDLIPQDATLVEPTLLRGALPEWRKLYEARNPAAAELVFRHCCVLARERAQLALAWRRNLIVDGIAANREGGFTSLLELLAGIGYETRVLLVGCPTATAESRNERRAEDDGLLIDPHLLASLHASVSEHLDEWRDTPAMLRVYRAD